MVAPVSELNGIEEDARAQQVWAAESNDSALLAWAYNDLVLAVNPDLIPAKDSNVRTKKVISPINGEVIGERRHHIESDEERAQIIQDARDTQKALSKLNVDQRVDLMNAFNKAVMPGLAPILANMITTGSGKSAAAAAGELTKASAWFGFVSADEQKNVIKNFRDFGYQTGVHVRDAKGQAITSRAQLTQTLLATRYADSTVDRASLPNTEVKGNGISFSQPPKNYPFALGIGDVVLAMFAGNSTIMKLPADMQDIYNTFAAYWNDFMAEYAEENQEELGLTGEEVAVLARRKVLQTVTSYGWEKDCDNARVVSSLDVGRQVYENYVRDLPEDDPRRDRFSGELAGANVMYIGPDLNDDELRFAAKQWCARVVDNMGMICTKIEDGMVHKDVADKFYVMVTEEFADFDVSTIGNPYKGKEGGVLHGKHTDAGSIQKAMDYLDECSEAGATVIGGSRIDERSMSPAVVQWPEGSTNDHLIRRGENIENFAPITNLSTVDDVEEAIDITNASQCNLTCSIWTKDTGAIKKFYEGTNLGSYNIFNPKHGSDNAPYGEHIGVYRDVNYVDANGEEQTLTISRNVATGGKSHIAMHLDVDHIPHAEDTAWISGEISEESTIRNLLNMGADFANDVGLPPKDIQEIADDYKDLTVQQLAPSLTPS